MKASSSPIVIEIKKDMLKKHLDQVRTLIERWQGELSAPYPFTYQKHGVWGWESVYVPSLENDGDDNHTVRKHLHSRMLWRHHSDWQHELSEIGRLVPEVREEARSKLAERSKETRWKYTDAYLGAALHEAFCLLHYGEVNKSYKLPNPGTPGFSWGAHRIEDTATSEKEGKTIEKEHLALVYDLAELPKMKDVAKVRWGKVCMLQERMRGLVKTAIKSNDILYPCKFCRHLWVP